MITRNMSRLGQFTDNDPAAAPPHRTIISLKLKWKAISTTIVRSSSSLTIGTQNVSSSFSSRSSKQQPLLQKQKFIPRHRDDDIWVDHKHVDGVQEKQKHQQGDLRKHTFDLKDILLLKLQRYRSNSERNLPGEVKRNSFSSSYPSKQKSTSCIDDAVQRSSLVSGKVFCNNIDFSAELFSVFQQQQHRLRLRLLAQDDEDSYLSSLNVLNDSDCALLQIISAIDDKMERLHKTLLLFDANGSSSPLLQPKEEVAAASVSSSSQLLNPVSPNLFSFATKLLGSFHSPETVQKGKVVQRGLRVVNDGRSNLDTNSSTNVNEKCDLMPFQREGVSWLLQLWLRGLHGILADEMGLGKTVQTIAFVWCIQWCLLNRDVVLAETGIDVFSRGWSHIHHQQEGSKKKRLRKQDDGFSDDTHNKKRALRKEFFSTSTSSSCRSSSVVNSKIKSNSIFNGSDRFIIEGSTVSTRCTVLIIAPLSTLHCWESEFHRFSPFPFKIGNLIHSQRDQRAKVAQQFLDGEVDVVLAPHHLFAKKKGLVPPLRRLLKYQTWTLLVVDEAHRIKNKHSNLFSELLNIHSSGRLLLTGTPLQNNVAELFNLMQFILPSHVHEAAHHDTLLKLLQEVLSGADKHTGLVVPTATSGTAKKRKSGGGTQGAANCPEETTDELEIGIVRNEQQEIEEKRSRREELQLLLCKRIHRLLEPFILRRERAEVLHHLPRKEEHVLECPLSTLQCFELEKLNYKTTSSAVNLSIQRRKVVLHPFLLRDEFMIDEGIVDGSGKMMVLDFLITFLRDCEPAHKFLIFSLWTMVLDVVETYCQLRRMPYVRLDGNTSGEKRECIVNRFNETTAAELPCFLVSKGAGGVGLNLQAADTVILFDVDYNPQRDLQALSRSYRVGQSKPVKVFWLVTTGCSTETSGGHSAAGSGKEVLVDVEARILKLAAEKLRICDMVVDAGRYDMKSTDADRHDALQRVIQQESKTSNKNVGENKASPAVVDGSCGTYRTDKGNDDGTTFIKIAAPGTSEGDALLQRRSCILSMSSVLLQSLPRSVNETQLLKRMLEGFAEGTNNCSWGVRGGNDVCGGDISERNSCGIVHMAKAGGEEVVDDSESSSTATSEDDLVFEQTE